MERSESKIFREAFAFALVLAFVSMFSACSDDKVAGGSSDDAGIYAVKDLDVAGVSQKGPFVKGSAVTVQGIDCKTMELTHEIFEGTVKSDKGDFGVDDVNLSATCALFEVTGYYFNEVTGKKSAGKVTLHALSDLSDRKHVNINMLTELEYKRVMNLVSEEKMSFDDAKKQAEKEVLASFSIKGDVAGSFDEAEDLNILEKGKGNAALLAVSVLVLADAKESKLAERLDEFSTAISKNGLLDDDAKTEIVKWASSAASSGKLDTIRKNIESWGYADEVPEFETYVSAVIPDSIENLLSSSSSSVTLSEVEGSSSSSGDSGSKAGTSSSCHSGQDPESSSGKDVVPAETSSSSVTSSSDKEIASSSSASIENSRTSYLNPNINYGEMTDSRDGQVYKTVKIGNQVWMAQNLNYADSVQMPSLKGKSWCYNDSAKYCEKYGRMYTWAAAIDSVKLATDKNNPVDCGSDKSCGLVGPVQGICPDGWHLPDSTEWRTLVTAVGGQPVAGKILKSQSGWKDNSDKGSGNGSDDVGFSAVPAGLMRVGSAAYSEGETAWFWSSTEGGIVGYAYEMDLDYKFDNADLNEHASSTRYAYSVRCLKGDVTPVFLEMEESPKDTYLNPNIKYDSIVDSRDGKVYKTVKIGDQVWMAQNLSYKMNGRFCYKNSVRYCNIYGGLYLWSAVVGDSESKCESRESCKIQGICPDGWHMPDTTEWSKLYSTMGKSGYAMQAKGFENWPLATDDYGFSALPAGNWFNDGFYNMGFTGDFWLTTRKDDGEPYYWDLNYDADRSGFKTLISSQMRLSIRCIKD